MMFFTADQHFGHANIIKYTNRPFSSVEEMDEELILRWNRVVGPEDIVYHLGDFTLGDRDQASRYFSRLNGSVAILRNSWHHDCRWLPAGDRMIPAWADRLNYVHISPPMVVFEPTGADVPIVLCHYPLAEWDRKHYGAWHLHGHSHGKHKGRGLILDVGVDCWDFRPVSLDDVAEHLRKKGTI